MLDINKEVYYLHHNQHNINSEVELMYYDAVNEHYTKFVDVKPLRNRSNVEVIQTENYYILRSNTNFIACIEKESGNCYDAQSKIMNPTKENESYLRWFSQDYGSTNRRHIWRYMI